MAVAAASRRSALLLLLLCALALAASSRTVDAARAVSGGAASPGRSHVPSAHEDDEDDEEDDDAWDFLSDASVVAAVEAQRRAVPCAASLDASFLNDDYCDCADGSDEPATNACALVSHGAGQQLSFHCASRASDGQRVAAAVVRDGVCDCCDGSDEAPGVCADSCSARREARLDALRKRLGVVRDAQWARDAYAEAWAPVVQGFHEQFEETAGRVAALQRAFQYKEHVLQSQMDETGEQPSAQELHELRRMYANLQYAQYSAYVQRKLTDRATFDAAAERAPFAALVGQCFPFTVNEKQLKGGSSNVIPREYVVVLCPFQNVTQTEPGYAAWQRAERESKTGVRDGDDDDEPATEPPAITMGVWDHWVDAPASTPTEEDIHPVVHRQRFDHGEPCANGQERVVNVDVLCGDENRVLSVEEPEMCVYAMRFETPAACSADQENALVTAIQAITERAHEAETETETETETQQRSSRTGIHEEL